MLEACHRKYAETRQDTLMRTHVALTKSLEEERHDAEDVLWRQTSVRTSREIVSRDTIAG